METLDRLCAEVPSLERHAKLARATYYSLKGDARTALALRQSVLDGVPPRDHVGWATSVAGQGQNLRVLGEPARARELLQRSIAQLNTEDRKVVVMTHSLFVELAHTLADLGDLAGAARLLDEQLEIHKDCEGPLVLGNLHTARAQIALRAGELDLASRHVAKVEQWFRPTANPLLIGLCAQLRRELSRSEGIHARLSIPPPDSDTRRSEHESVRSVLSDCRGPQERADRALRLLLDYTGGQSGYLFQLAPAGLRLLSPTHGDDPPPELHERVRAALSAGEQEDTSAHTTADQVTNAKSEVSHDAVSEPLYSLLVLRTDPNSRESVVGAAAIACGAKRLRAPTSRMLQSIALALYEQGDAA
jgi:hypothetical protein